MAAHDPQTITKKELVNRIAERSKQTKVVVKDIVQQFLDEIVKELADGNRLEFREFGVFEVKERAARTAQNPRTLEKVEVPAKRVVKFKVGRLMRQHVGDDDEDVAGAPAAGAKASAGGKPPTRPAAVPQVAPPAVPAPPREPPKPPPSNSPF
ncbi:MAG: integration host factor subunit beta [Planctomycetes bacterium]|nr:integration host factor subunit beta [Planctomycetota bacterium]